MIAQLDTQDLRALSHFIVWIQESERLKKKLNNSLAALNCLQKQSAAQSHPSRRSSKKKKATRILVPNFHESVELQKKKGLPSLAHDEPQMASH